MPTESGFWWAMPTLRGMGILPVLISHLPHPKLSHNEKWSFGDLGLAIAT
ncbi:hypothetical protein MEN24_03070 [Dolichospermum sp. ST_sed10]|nr:hypothetical protein [Dolichospermum sp. ST_sed10]